jgi:hypothetical protein
MPRTKNVQNDDIVELENQLFAHLSLYDTNKGYNKALRNGSLNVKHGSAKSAYGKNRQKLEETISLVRGGGRAIIKRSRYIADHIKVLELLDLLPSPIATLFTIAIPLYFSEHYSEAEVLSALHKINAMYQSLCEFNSDDELKLQALRVLCDLYKRGNQYIPKNEVLYVKYCIKYYALQAGGVYLEALEDNIKNGVFDFETKDMLIKRCQFHIYLKRFNSASEFELYNLMDSLDKEDPEEYKLYTKCYLALYEGKSGYIVDQPIYSHCQIQDRLKKVEARCDDGLASDDVEKRSHKRSMSLG